MDWNFLDLLFEESVQVVDADQEDDAEYRGHKGSPVDVTSEDELKVLDDSLNNIGRGGEIIKQRIEWIHFMWPH